MIWISTEIVMWILFAAASACSFMIGKVWSQRDQDLIIENTIMYLVKEKLVKWKYDENGEIELLPLDEK